MYWEVRPVNRAISASTCSRREGYPVDNDVEVVSLDGLGDRLLVGEVGHDLLRALRDELLGLSPVQKVQIDTALHR